MRFRTPTIKVPLSEIEASKRLARREAAAHERRISLMLRSITRKVVDYRSCPQSEMSIEEFRHLPSRAGRFARTTPIRVANMKSGVGILFTTEDFLEDRVHRLTIPSTGEVEYSRWAVNVDCQKIPSANVEVAGFKQLAAGSEIYPSLNFCMGALAVEASNGWTHAFK